MAGFAIDDPADREAFRVLLGRVARDVQDVDAATDPCDVADRLLVDAPQRDA